MGIAATAIPFLEGRREGLGRPAVDQGPQAEEVEKGPVGTSKLNANSHDLVGDNIFLSPIVSKGSREQVTDMDELLPHSTPIFLYRQARRHFDVIPQTFIQTWNLKFPVISILKNRRLFGWRKLTTKHPNCWRLADITCPLVVCAPYFSNNLGGDPYRNKRPAEYETIRCCP